MRDLGDLRLIVLCPPSQALGKGGASLRALRCMGAFESKPAVRARLTLVGAALTSRTGTLVPTRARPMTPPGRRQHQSPVLMAGQACAPGPTRPGPTARPSASSRRACGSWAYGRLLRPMSRPLRDVALAARRGDPGWVVSLPNAGVSPAAG
ncbi:hypothetical protein CC_2413 [Caulobacter vibrioides CB15]|uniref:Uncharacterized protein n=1 Tax=Caulobacter vibrioides (strain ATCC 19089 / CIP 103742 / CB 15) TaxID=190650 RepID=Q9A5N4_CAUVC|nr:hypothetical protein CC_2413 [Caulobacter vibrioides CB15]ATC29267.1 hypothetical protein CA607_13080 [Caulobacter vibrioides]